MHASVYVDSMATKTISVDLEAYERLRRARRTPSKSFSQVIERATWPSPPNTTDELLRAISEALPPDAEAIDRRQRPLDRGNFLEP